MNVEQLQAYCASLAYSSVNHYADNRNVITYSLDHKKFAYFKTSEPERWRFSIKVSPERFLELTDQEGIDPARYMKRFYWISIVTVQRMDPNYLKELVQYSYQQVWQGLSKKRQRALTQEE